MRLDSIWVTTGHAGTGWLVSWPSGDTLISCWFDTWAEAITYADQIAKTATVRETESPRTGKTRRVVFPEQLPV